MQKQAKFGIGIGIIENGGHCHQPPHSDVRELSAFPYQLNRTIFSRSRLRGLAGNVDLFLPGILRPAISQFDQDHF